MRATPAYLLAPLALLSFGCDPIPTHPARTDSPAAPVGEMAPAKGQGDLGQGQSAISLDPGSPYANTTPIPTAYDAPVSEPGSPPQAVGDGVGVPGFGGARSSNDARPSVPPLTRIPFRPLYREAIRRTARMAQDPEAQSLARSFGLDVLNLTWEDTGRYQNSTVGPNISDMTIQAVDGPQAWCMPVIRHPNFSDTTCDLDPHDLTLLVGNERGLGLRRVSLYDFLGDPTAFLTKPRSWTNPCRSLLAPRDHRVLVSAQACFLPVPKQGIAKFNPVLFNYQSSPGDPAVLTILATREGTSVTVIDGSRDVFSEGSAWGQRLFHNENGIRASLTGQRLSDYVATPRSGGGATSEVGMSMVMLIQVPLKHRIVARDGDFGIAPATAAAAPMAKAIGRARVSDTETAVIGHGEAEGPFTEIGGLSIERDPDFPVRVTVQFYKATSTGVISEPDMRGIKNQIDRVYSQSDSVGSLVTDGETGRPTEYIGCKVQPSSWWEQFWQRHEQETGEPRAVTIAKLRHLLGEDFEVKPVTELFLRDKLRPRARS